MRMIKLYPHIQKIGQLPWNAYRPLITLAILSHLFIHPTYADIDLEAMVEPIQQKTWIFVRIIEGLIAGAAAWRMLLSMSPAPIVLGVIGISLLELMKQFLR